MAQDLYRPPDYQRPVQGVVVAVTEGESNPRHRVAIMRRGEDIIVNAYLDDPAYAAVGVGEDVQIARDAGGTWRLQRRTEHRLSDTRGTHLVEAVHIGEHYINLARIRAQSEDGRRFASATVFTSLLTAVADVTARGGDFYSNLSVRPGATFLGDNDNNFATSTANANTTVSGGGAVGNWVGGAANFGPAGSAGDPVGVLVAPANGLPATLVLDVEGQPGAQTVTIPVAQLMRLATALQVYPEGISGATAPVVPPPTVAPAVTTLSAGMTREPRQFRRDLYQLTVAWAGGDDDTVAVRRQYSGVPGAPIATAFERTPATRMVTLTSGGGAKYAVYHVPSAPGNALLRAGQGANDDSSWSFIVAVDQPITDLSVPAGVTVPAITDGVRKLTPTTALWERWDYDVLSTIPAPGVAPRQVILANAKLAPGFRFGDAPASE